MCRTPIERLLQARLVYSKAVMSRALSFDYLNRQLVWHQLSELLLFVLPLLNVTRFKRLLQTCLPAVRTALAPTAVPGLHTPRLYPVKPPIVLDNAVTSCIVPFRQHSVFRR